MSEQDISKRRYALLLLFTHFCSQKQPGLYVIAHPTPTSHQMTAVGSDAQASAECAEVKVPAEPALLLWKHPETGRRGSETARYKALSPAGER